MWANNETGVIFPIEKIAAIVHAHGIPFHVDAVQAAGKLPLNVKELPVDLLTISGHKFHAPKGVGALYVRRSITFSPFMIGGHQERNRRAGTENVAGIVGMGQAAEIALARIAADMNMRENCAINWKRCCWTLVPESRVNGGNQIACRTP